MGENSLYLKERAGGVLGERQGGYGRQKHTGEGMERV